MAALCAANFSSQPTSSPIRSCWSESGSKRMPSGARSISMPSWVTTTRPAVSRSSIVAGPAAAEPPFVPNESGSKPRRSVKRHDSWRVSGIGSAA